MTLSTQQIAINPLQYFATADGWLDPSLGPPLEARLQHIAAAGFTAVQAEVPVSSTPAEYKELLSSFELQPGPGYVNFAWSDDAADRDAALDRAAALARAAVEVGNPLLFLSMAMEYDAVRVAHPAVGYESTAERRVAIRDHLAMAAERITAEGGVAALHPHVGSWVETADETRFVLDTVDPKILRFGPDAGHLAWTGADPAAVIAEYADRVAGIHIKDYHESIARRCREEQWDYRRTARAGIWTELGTGDMDVDGVLRALPDSFDGWIVIEVDRGTTPTPEESINMCGEWLANQFAAAPR
jgi:inosose dehydratase